MNKKLPNVFANKNANVINTNKETYYSKEKIETNLENENINQNVRKKIDDIFNSENFVYKVKVIITTNEKDMECTVIAKNNDSLLTIDNKHILINEILDIKKI